MGEKIMKKKRLIIGIFVVIFTLSCIWFITRPEKLGNMSHSSTEAETSTSDISFEGEAGQKLRFYFSSDIRVGEMHVALYDSAGNVVYEFDKAKELVDYLTLETTDTYTLEVEYKDFVGDFKAVITKAR